MHTALCLSGYTSITIKKIQRMYIKMPYKWPSLCRPCQYVQILLMGYLYGNKSERRLVQEIQLNIASRWFCVFELGA